MALLPLLLSRRLTRWAPGCCHPPLWPPRVCSAPASSAATAKDTPGAATAAGPRANTNGNTTRTRTTTTTTTTTSPNANAHASNGDALHAARTWLAELHAQTIPIGAIGELTFSRSSGPGGQNVNKVNSKATLKVPLEALLRHVPAALHGELKRSRYLAANSSTLVVHADDSRKQSDNVRSCYRRLHDAIVDAGRNAVPAETSPEQVQRVKLLQKSDNERRLKSKKQQSAKKSSRRARGDD